jgi:hypothetical protein
VGGTCSANGEKRNVYRLLVGKRELVTVDAVPSSAIPVALMMEATRSSETSALTRATQRNIEKTYSS